MLEELPVEITTNVVEFLDIASRIKLARPNVTLQRRVYRDCFQEWRRLNFRLEEDGLCKRITDSDLSILLTRVNAKEVTKELHLTDCVQIRGNGLTPIRNSQVIEVVCLQDTGANQDVTPFLWNLRNSVAFKLYEVIVKPCTEGYESDAMTDFIRNLRETNIYRAQVNGTQCHKCLDPVADASRQLVPNFHGKPSTHCGGCLEFFCRGPRCPMDVKECGNCSSAFCNCLLLRSAMRFLQQSHL